MARLKPHVSIVIPAFQAEATIGGCVRALASQSLPPDGYEIIVVDDGSSDGTAMCASNAGARVIRFAHNRGPAAARNAGVQHASGDLVVFTDADCEAAPEFITGLTAPLEDRAVGGTKGTYLTHQRSVLARLVQHEYEDRYRHTARQPCLDFVDTYACCFRRDDVLHIGGFDPSLRVCEDQDLSFRLARGGIRILFAPEARTYHRHCDRLPAYVRKKFRIARWKVRVLQRHPDKMLHDSHTPRLLKVEIPLACGLALCIACYRRWRPLSLLGLAYLGAIAPSVMRAARHDPGVGLVAPAIYLARDLALGAGLIAGLIDLVRDERCGS